MTAHLGDLADTPVDVVRRVVDVNLVAVLLCLRRAAQLMSTARGGAGGAIVTISSSSTSSGSAHEYVHYAAAKAGVEVATLGLARELARDGVRVNCVAPGLVDTGIHADAGDATRPARMAPQIPLAAPVTPTRSPQPWRGCSGRRPRTSPAPRCGSLAAAEAGQT